MIDGKHAREARPQIVVELLVERLHVGVQHALEHLVGRQPFLICLQHLEERRLAVVARDQLAHERRLVVRELHLLADTPDA